jgi:hypothetical protein
MKERPTGGEPALRQGILDVAARWAHRRGTGGGFVFRFRRSPKGRPSASGPHDFAPPTDARSGLALGSFREDVPMAAAFAVAAASLRTAHCALPGCGKPREDPIHWPSE